MPNKYFNWTFKDVEGVLKDHNFILNHIRGSHHYYTAAVEGKMKQVCVPRHGQIALKPRTMKGIIEQSGIDKEVWFKN
jgi:predicted RNA binding protein YcfA (HicA-like mRNA interferase family)